MVPLSTAQRKSALRAQIRSARRALSEERLAARDAAVDAQAASLAAQFGRGDVVSSYLPRRTEPGTGKMLSVFVARGAQVLVPVVVGPDAALQWRAWPQEGPALPGEALAEASLVLVPALAVDRLGVRLGQGGGHYDRSLGHADPRARLVAVVDHGELFGAGELPQEPHDRALGWALVPTGLVRLGPVRAAGAAEGGAP